VSFSIRPTTPADAAFVMELFSLEHVRTFTHGPTSTDDFLRALERGRSENCIVERDGAPFGNLMLDSALDWLAELRVIAVREPRCGAGAFALSWALERAFAEHGVHRFYLEAVASNVGARALYARFGLRAEGCFRDGYRADSGLYEDLVPYALLAHEYAALRATIV